MEALDTTSSLQSSGRSLHALTYTLLFASNILLLSLLWLGQKPTTTPCIRPQLAYSPAKDEIAYQKRRLMRDIDHNVFTGEPSAEFDEAWGKLIEPITIRISQAELDILGETSIALRDGSGFIGELAMYHELHCVKRIRRHFHLDRYYPNMTAEERVKEEVHIDHCLEYWREAAMCRGDTTLATFRWRDGLAYSTVYSDHECVDWDRLDSWARTRMVDLSDYSIVESR